MAITVQNPSSESAGERHPDELDKKDRVRRGRLLPDHLHLDPHPRPLRPGEEPPGLDPRLRQPHGRARGRPPRGDRRPGRHRHRRHAVPGGQTAERRRRAGLCRRSRPGSRHDLHRRRQPAVAGDLAAGPGRSGRSKRGRAGHHQRVARRGLQLDVPALTEPHAGLQRTAAGLLDVPVPARAPHHSLGRAHRSPVPHLHRHRDAVRRLEAGLPPARRSPGGCLGAVAGRVAGRQGLPALPDHRRNGRRPARRAPTRTSRPDLRQHDTAGPSPRARPVPRRQPGPLCRWPCCTDAGLTGPGARAGSRRRR